MPAEFLAHRTKTVRSLDINFKKYLRFKFVCFKRQEADQTLYQEVPSYSVSDGSIYCDRAWFFKFRDEFENKI